MIKTRVGIVTCILSAWLAPRPARAEVTFLEKDDWHVGMTGFVEFDGFFDSTRSFTEVVGNGPVARLNTYNGDNGRTQFSMRNTRLGFNVIPPVQFGWATRFYLETDFLGYEPAVAPGSETEAAAFQNPTLRMRHAYFTAENDGLQFLVGQTWTLFGWQPTYFLSTVSVAPIPATLYQRTPRFSVIKTVRGEDADLQAGVSLQRPTQRDGEIPNVDAGVRLALNGRKGGMTSPNADIKLYPLSIGLSGTFREYEFGVPGGAVGDSTHAFASAGAADLLVPILASPDGKTIAGTLTFSAEATIGTGYGDEFTGWTGGLGQTAATSPSPPNATTNLDPGIGGFNLAGERELVHLATWNAQLQYHLIEGTFATLGYSYLDSKNIGDFGTGIGVYDREQAFFVNLCHDFTAQIRGAIELDQFSTHYISDNATARDNRVIVAGYFRL